MELTRRQKSEGLRGAGVGRLTGKGVDGGIIDMGTSSGDGNVLDLGSVASHMRVNTFILNKSSWFCFSLKRLTQAARQGTG